MKRSFSLALAVSLCAFTSFAGADEQSKAFADLEPSAITQDVQDFGHALGLSDQTNIFASEAQTPGPAPESDTKGAVRSGPCSKLKLDDTQKESLRTALFDYKREQITLGSELKIAALNYAQIVTTTGSTRADADAAGAQYSVARDKFSSSKVSFKTKFLYDILNDEQRTPGFICLMWLKYHKQHAQSQ